MCDNIKDSKYVNINSVNPLYLIITKVNEYFEEIDGNKYLTIVPTTARKTIFSFSKCSEKMIFPKQSHWNMIFLVSSGNMIFLFPKNLILLFRRKMKDDLSQKNTWKYDKYNSSNVPKRWSFKKLHSKMIFLIS